ncbi:hypothetical protein HOD20_08545 [archaeon]|nr:hypothetical protein [archaeon]MBT4352558.1 hypothetical protein [archaeon]MBT4648579.1 hypothetical protein [archaeon]MBT6821418.1 hypothetical protein [archaeon]MBT7393013.1 hypothetical protein [archaeon]
MKQFLEDVPKEHVFKIGDKTLNNLHDLLYELNIISDEDFTHYVGDDHNHFCNWINSIVKDKELAKKIENEKDRQKTVEILESRIVEIQEHIDKTSEDKAEPEKTEKTEDSKEKEDVKLIEDNNFHEDNKGFVDMTNVTDEKNKKSEEILEKESPKEEKKAETPIEEKADESSTHEDKTADNKEEKKINVPGIKEKKKRKHHHQHHKHKDNIDMHNHMREIFGQKYDLHMAKEFFQGIVLGIIVGLIIAKIIGI